VSLFDIFPEHIAEALRDGRNIDAEEKEEVTMYDQLFRTGCQPFTGPMARAANLLLAQWPEVRLEGRG